MHAMLTKEWYTQGKWICLLLFVLAVCLFWYVGYFEFAEMILPFVIAVLPLFSLNRDAVSHFERWYPAMPVKRSSYADFYYIMTAVLTGLLLAAHLYYEIRHMYSPIDLCLLGVLGTHCLLMPAVYLPVTFRFGIAAGRIAALLVLPVYVILPCLHIGVLDWFNWFSPENRSVGTMVLGVGMLLGFLLSRMLSVRALRRAEY